MHKPYIYNCHTHLFTHRHIPQRFFPFFLLQALDIQPLRRSLRWVMNNLIPWSKKDLLQRYAALLNAPYQGGQEPLLKTLCDYYPPDTRFIVLPMDMSQMGAGKVEVNIDQQHQELADLAKQPAYQGRILPFAHIDPRNNAGATPRQRLEQLVEQHGFRGVKIYPALGYRPSDHVLMDDIYPYLQEKGLPIIAHCSPGDVVNRAQSKKATQDNGKPAHYAAVFKAFPALKICLAHFGGINEWRRYLDNPWDPVAMQDNWLAQILAMLRSGDYPNLYVYISYTLFNFQENVALLKLLLLEPAIRERVLFGSDYYLVAQQKYPEKRLSIDLRAALGEALFWQIAYHNPRRFLAEPAA